MSKQNRIWRTTRMEYQVKYKSELYHHGILGQKWGKRNGPPYPLDAEDHSPSEKRAGWKKSIGKLQLTDSQKMVLKIGAAVVVAGLATYGVYKVSQLGVNAQTAKDFDYDTFTPDTFTPDTFKPDTFEVKDVMLVDPDNYLPRGNTSGKLKESIDGVNSSNEKDHCQQNSLVAALKYMGFGDIDTRPGVWSTSPGSIVSKCFKGDDSKKIKEPNLVFDTSDKASDWIMRRLKPENGSCGTISCKLSRGRGDGHAIMWCMEDGVIKYSDPWARTPTGYRRVEDASYYFGDVFSGEHPVISRIDNLEIDPEGFDKYFIRK